MRRFKEKNTMNFSEDIQSHRVGFDPADLQDRAEKSRTFWLPATGLNFLDDHFGFRPGCLHVLMGSTGKGKSTLAHSLICTLGEKAELLLYLTEESPERVEMKLAAKDVDVSYLMPKLQMLHERMLLNHMTPDTPLSFLRALSDELAKTEAKILIIDNLTTSAFFDGKFSASATIIAGLKNIAEKFNIPVFILAHTKKGINETTRPLMTPDDIRGSAQLALQADYFYIFYRIRKTAQYGQTIDTAAVYVSKSRDHDNQDSVYKLEYRPEQKRYYADKLVNFQIFKSLMKERDKI